jgi:diketogulonate reductase-like aldo/keto reductase
LEAFSPLASGGDVLKDKVLMEIGHRHNKTVAQVAIKFQAQRDVVVIPMSTHKNRIIENFNIFDFELTEDDLAKIAKIDKQH